MSSYRPRNPNRNRSRDPLERKMDQLIETGRQFVDGVAGTRPGQRKIGKPIGDGLDNMGRWVGEKLDWFFEEEDDWIEPWQLEQNESEMNLPNKKRPLQAISLRGTKAISPAVDRQNSSDEEHTWPDESTFRVNRWEREEEQGISDTRNLSKDRAIPQPTSSRPLPRSSRRRA